MAASYYFNLCDRDLRNVRIPLSFDEEDYLLMTADDLEYKKKLKRNGYSANAFLFDGLIEKNYNCRVCGKHFKIGKGAGRIKNAFFNSEECINHSLTHIVLLLFALNSRQIPKVFPFRCNLKGIEIKKEHLG